MKRINVLALMSAAVIGLGFSSCEAMLDSSLDVPLGYGSSLGVPRGKKSSYYENCPWHFVCFIVYYGYSGIDIMFWKFLTNGRLIRKT